jgi:hypothetical protein
MAGCVGGCDDRDMHVTIARTATGSTRATIRRDDGVVLELPGYDRKFRVPHDLAHAVTERALGMSRGVFGSIAGGGVFDNMRVVAGHRPATTRPCAAPACSPPTSANWARPN